MSGLVRYESLSDEQYEQESRKADAMSGSTFLEVPEGDTAVRFVPSRVGAGAPMRAFKQHWVRDMPGLDRVISFACPLAEGVGQCPVCDLAAKLLASNNATDRKRGQSLQARLTIMTWVVDRGAVEMDDTLHGLRLYSYGKGVKAQLDNIRRNPRSGGDYYSPEPSGFDIVISREGTGLATKYTLLPDRSPSPLGPTPEESQWYISNAPSLETYVNCSIPEELEVLIAGTAARVGKQQAQQLPPSTRDGGGAVGAGLFSKKKAAPLASSDLEDLDDL